MATIDALPLSNRTRARLHEAGIRSLSQLSGLADDDLLRLRGFGHTCLREVRAVLRIFEERDAGMTIPNDTFPKSVPDSLLDTPLASLPISNRARGVFEREQIRTIGQFIALGEERLLRLRNFGETTLEAVNRAIHTAARRVESGDGTDLGSFAVSSLLARDNELKQSIAQIPVAALDLSRRARRACREMGLRTLKDLAGVSANEFLVRRNFGQATLLSIQDEVERFVRDYGSNPLTTFASVIDHLLSRLQQKERRLVELRERRGRSATPRRSGAPARGAAAPRRDRLGARLARSAHADGHRAGHADHRIARVPDRARGLGETATLRGRSGGQRRGSGHPRADGPGRRREP